MSKTVRGLGAVLLAAWLAAALPGVAGASPVSIPNTFSNGETADADEVNANFSALKDAVDDNDARISTLQTVTPLQVVEVTAVGGDATASGTALLDALAAITDASAARPYLVRVSSGAFNLGSQTLTMQDYVSIEGAGEAALAAAAVRTDPPVLVGGTRISGTGTPVVAGAAHSSLSNLAVRSTFADAVIDNAAEGFRLDRVTVVSLAPSGVEQATGVENSGTLSITHTTIFAFGASTIDGNGAGFGLRNDGGSADVHASTIYATGSDTCTSCITKGGGVTETGYGIYNEGTAGVVTVHGTTLSGSGASVYNVSAYTVNMMGSFLTGAVVAGPSTNVSCLLTYAYGISTYTTSDAQTTVDVPSFVSAGGACTGGGGGQSKQN